MRALLFVVMCGGLFSGCSNAPQKPKTAGEVHADFFEITVEGPDVSDHMVVDDGQMIIFSSVPIEGGSSVEFEKKFFKEFRNVMSAVSRWKREHPGEKVSIAVSERGGHAQTHAVHNAYYTVRVVLLRE